MKVRDKEVSFLQDFLELIAFTMTSRTTTTNKLGTLSNPNTNIPRTNTITFISKVVRIKFTTPLYIAHLLLHFLSRY